MFKKIVPLFLILIFTIVTINFADEGMWTLDALNQLPWAEMKAGGLTLSPEDIYNPKGVGLADAVVQLGGGTGSFVSPNGLILTNHHVAYGAIQRQSSAEQDFIRNGFLAKTLSDEIPAKGYTARLCISFEDVTKKVLKGITDKMSYSERNDLIEKNSRALVEKAEKDDYIRANVANMLSGTKYYLFTYFVIKDIRLVYAPPRSVGEYGGDIDNWMWPRHTGDFSFLRAYVGSDGKPADYSDQNIPYKPKKYLKISLAGINKDDFTMVIGYPGNTLRYRSSYSVDVWQNEIYPAQIHFSEISIKALEDLAGDDRELQIKYSSRIKGLNNGLKYTQGMMDGLKRTRLLEKKQKQEAEFTKFLKQNPELDKKYGQVLPEIAKVYTELWTYNHKQTMLGNLFGSSQLLNGANFIHRWSIEKQKKEKDREPGFSDRNIERVKKQLEIGRDQIDIPSDKKLLAIMIDKAADLPEGQKIEAIQKVVGTKTGKERKEAAKKFVEDTFSRTIFTDFDKAMELFDKSEAEINQLNDPLIQFAAELQKENKAIQDKYDEFVGAVFKLRPPLIQGMYEWKKGSLYPDANGTIRFTYGYIKGYQPRDAVKYNWITTLKGVIEKDTGEEPFDNPRALNELFNNKDFGQYFDQNIKGVPVNFLHTTDLTGGNSGSPVLNGKGEVIGVVFDGNYEAMTSDFVYDPDLTRTISVDVRYVLFITEKLGKADNVLKELEIVGGDD
jgi:hypothetical protein